MNAEKFTQKSIEAIQTAQSLARQHNNPSIAPEHLLHALVTQDGGLIPSLFNRLGADCAAIAQELQSLIAAMPRVSSNPGTGRATGTMSRKSTSSHR